jgi:hypothetical protein
LSSTFKGFSLSSEVGIVVEGTDSFPSRDVWTDC